MKDTADFRLGADVVTSDGKKAGSLISVLVEENGFDPRAIVVRAESTLLGRLISDEKLFITDEVEVPIASVQAVSHDAVQLNMSGQDLRAQQPYLSYRFKAESRGELLLQEMQMLGGGLGIPNAEEIADKPSSEIEIDRDENVMLGKTGRILGHVHDVLFDHGELIGIVLKPAGFRKQDVVLPVRFVSRGDDMALFADIDAAQLESLKPFSSD